MAKVSLNNLANLQNETSAVTTINNNNNALEAALENTLSRDGTEPNEMNADLDMNSNRIYNLPEAVAATEPLRKGEAQEILDLVDEFEEVIEATQGAVDAYESIQALYLGEKTVLPTLDNLGQPLQSGAMVSLVDQVDPDNDGLYVYHDGAWGPVGVLPAAFERVEYILATAGQTSVTVPNGYSVGTTKVFRNGALQRIGSNLGIGPEYDDVTASNGTSLTWPADALDEDDLITVVVTQSFAVGTAINVGFVPAGSIAATNVQSAIEELDTEKASTGALALKADLVSPTFTGTVGGITKTMVGLSNVDNTADTAKPVSTDQQTALNLKANLDSPALTGTPTAPTAATSTNTTQVATTAFVQQELTAAAINPGLILISSGLTGNSLTIALGTTYRRFLLKLRRCEPQTAGAYLRAFIATDGVPTYITTANYTYAGTVAETGSASITAWQGTASEFQFVTPQPAAAGFTGNFDIEIENSGPSFYSTLLWKARTRTNAGSVTRTTNGAAEFVGTSARWTHIEFSYNSGFMSSSAEYALYGYKE